MSSQREEYLKALHYNNATDGFNYYYTRAIQNRYQLLSSVGFNNVFSNYHNTSGVAMVVGNKVPIFGNGGARWVSDENNAPYNLGYNVLYNGDEDDDYTGGTTLPFQFFIGGSGYTNIYTGTNTYFTFGDGSDDYDDLSANNPNIPKIFVGAEDHSYQRVWDKVSSECYRVRYEGTNDTSGDQGDPSIVIEATFCNPALYNGKNVCEIVVGNHNATTEISMIASADAQLCYNAPSLEEYSSYVFVGDAVGEYWTIFKGRYLKNPPYSY